MISTEHTQSPSEFRQNANQTLDRINQTGEPEILTVDGEATCTIDDPGMSRRITIEKTNAKSTVVWNPVGTRAAQLQDLGADNWPGFVCVESGNVNESMIHLDVGGRHETTVTIGVAKV